MKPFRIVLLGIGTVGTAVLSLLRKFDSIEVIAIMSRNASERLKHQAPEYLLQLSAIFDHWQDLQKALEQKTLAKPDAVVELLGGTDCAEIYRYFLEQQVPMITANKALLAEYGTELFPLAQKNGTFIAAEASCGGGIPILQTLVYSSYQIHEFHAVLNGTCNYILSQMAGRSYSEVLAEAQSRGFAEADPFLDVSGTDSAHKLAILAVMSFGTGLRLEDILLQGIEELRSEHVQVAEQLGLALKLVASASCDAGQLALRVGPCFVGRQNSQRAPASPLAELTSSFNGISFYAHNVGHIYLQGRGAGASATATAVLADLCQSASGAYGQAFDNFANWPSPEKMQKNNTWSTLKRDWLIFTSAALSAEKLLSLQDTKQDTKVYRLCNTAQEALPDLGKTQYIPILEFPAEKLLPELS